MAKINNKRYPDSANIYLDEVPALLGPVRDWPQVRRVESPAVFARFHSEHGYCMACGISYGVTLEAHDLASGSRKSAELTNLLMLCQACHREIQSSKELLPFALFCKWKHDRPNLNWIRLTLLLGRFVGELQTKILV